MALVTTIKEVTFGVGDTIKVTQKVSEGDKERQQAFEGIVIGIKGRDSEKSFTVRRIGSQKIGIERIFPVNSPSISSVEVIRRGLEGSRHAKLYLIRSKAKKDIEEIYSRANTRINSKS